VERKFLKAQNAGQFKSHDYLGQLAEAEKAGLIDSAEAALLKRVREGVFEFISVDDFDPAELGAAKAKDETKKLADAA